MTYSPDTPIIGPATGTLAEALGWLDIKAGPETEYATELWRLCKLVDIDPALLFAQAAHETGDFSSYWWQYRRNPAGIGITGDKKQNEASQTWANGVDAARAHVIHMFAYTLHWAPKDLIDDLKANDQRFLDVLIQPWAGTVRTLNDLTGKWATDPKYHEKVAAKANAIFPNRPQEVTPSMATITYGNVPHPPYQNRPITKPEAAGQNNLGKRTVKGVTYHRILGSLWGTDTYFRRPDVKALTDYGVGVLAQDGAANAGLILKWNDPLGFQSGWASGTYSSAAYGDGAAFVAKYGINAINQHRVSIEISGFEETPLDPKALESIAQLSAYYADQAHIPWSSYPVVPADGFSFVAWHEEFGPDNGQKKCPFAEVKRETPGIIERTRQIMKQYQEATVPKPDPVYATPLPITWKVGDLGWRKLGDVSVYCLEAEVEVVRATTPLAWADGDKSDGTKAPNAGPKIKQGEKVKVIGSFSNLNAKGQTVRWLIRASDNARIIGSSCRPLLPIKQ